MFGFEPAAESIILDVLRLRKKDLEVVKRDYPALLKYDCSYRNNPVYTLDRNAANYLFDWYVMRRNKIMFTALRCVLVMLIFILIWILPLMAWLRII